MKTIMLLVCLTLASPADARTPLYKAEPASVPDNASGTRPRPSKRSEGATPRNWSMVVRGNPVITPSGQVVKELGSLNVGEMFLSLIPHSVIAFSDQKAPVAAKLSDENGNTFTLLGEASLERASKRILINFKTIHDERTNEVFEIQASALSLDGTLGVEGEVFSNASSLFIAEFAAAAAAGFADASINRSTNAFGTQQDENSIDTRSKKALGSSLSRTADRFAERQKQNPECAVLKGPVRIKILITESPKRKL